MLALILPSLASVLPTLYTTTVWDPSILKGYVANAVVCRVRVVPRRFREGRR
jgi:hypothetical protein